MNENLKKAGKVALIVVTPTVILLIVLVWYLWKKRQDKKKSGNKEDSDYISCQKCDWSWKKSDGGSDLYVCHKCGHDNTPS